jgi:hypothetical protein
MTIADRIFQSTSISDTSSNQIIVDEMIERAKQFITSFCNFKTFPELSKGYVISGDESPDIVSGSLIDYRIPISINHSPIYYYDFTGISDSTGGDEIASFIQTVLRTGDTKYGCDEVEVLFNDDTSSYYIISGRYGIDSIIEVVYDVNCLQLARELKLLDIYAAKTYSGNFDNDIVINALIMLVECLYRKLGLEGLASGNTPGGMSFNIKDIDANILSMLVSQRRLK